MSLLYVDFCFCYCISHITASQLSTTFEERVKVIEGRIAGKQLKINQERTGINAGLTKGSQRRIFDTTIPIIIDIPIN